MDANDMPQAGRLPLPEADLYLPFGATDPDFYLPTDCDRRSGRFSRWLRSLPIFDR